MSKMQSYEVLHRVVYRDWGKVPWHNFLAATFKINLRHPVVVYHWVLNVLSSRNWALLKIFTELILL